MTNTALNDPSSQLLVKLLTVNEVADVLGCGRTTVYDLIDKGQLTRIKVGRLTRIPPSEVDRFVRRAMGLEPAWRGSSSRASRRSETATLRLPL
jgi:excisionase family DNA binding protein